MAIINNRLGRSATIRLTANATINMSSLAVTNSGISNVSETVAGATITRIWWVGNTTISRGANLVFQAPAGTSGAWLLDGNPITDFSSANLVFTVDAGGTVVCEVHKQENTPITSPNTNYISY
jgi:hypothetical protein